MRVNKILIVLGEPQSTFSEILLKYFYSKEFSKNKKKIILIGSKSLLQKHLKILKINLKFKFRIINHLKEANVREVNIININYNNKKKFSKISSNSSKYITNCFNLALSLIRNNEKTALINGPISKKHFLKKKYLGITEYISKKIKSKNQVMLIYNDKLAVTPLTTHLPIKYVSKEIKKKKIIKNVIEIRKFYINFLNKKPKIAILGLNPHCETIDKFSEEKKIIIPAINYLKKNNTNISGPFPADTFFLKKNIIKYDVVVGMYHDQVLTPFKTLFKFDAINITLGLKYLRVSPDHGIASDLIFKKKANPSSLISCIKFIERYSKWFLPKNPLGKTS